MMRWERIDTIKRQNRLPGLLEGPLLPLFVVVHNFELRLVVLGHLIKAIEQKEWP